MTNVVFFFVLPTRLEELMNIEGRKRGAAALSDQ